MKIQSERNGREYSKGDLEVALKFYNIARKFDSSVAPCDSVDAITPLTIDYFLSIAMDAGFDQYGDRMVRMFEQQVLDTDLHGKEPKVYTSYYGNGKILNLYGVVKVRIAQFAPRFEKAHASCTCLAPSKNLLAASKSGSLGDGEFTAQYEKEISGLDAATVYKDLLELGSGRDVAILCYEKPPDFCHRHITANWFKDELGIELIEFPHK